MRAAVVDREAAGADGDDDEDVVVLRAARSPTPEPAGRSTANSSIRPAVGWTGSETALVVQHSPLPELTIAKRSGAGAAPLLTRTRVTAPAPRGTYVFATIWPSGPCSVDHHMQLAMPVSMKVMLPAPTPM